MVEGCEEGAEGCFAVKGFREDEGRAWGMDVDAVTDHGGRVEGVAEFFSVAEISSIYLSWKG